MAEIIRNKNPQDTIKRDLIVEAIERLKERYKTTADKKLEKAIASQYPRTNWNISYKAIASKKDRFTITLDMVLVPLDVANKNNQCIPKSEEQNIIDTALNKPIRASLSSLTHANTSNIGLINEVYSRDNIIYGNGIVWTDNNEDLEDYLLDKETHYGSFEVFYATSKRVGNVEYLQDVIFASQCIVSNPAYDNTSIRVRV